MANASTPNDMLLAALHNLYALEGNAISTLENVRDRLKDYPQLEAAVTQHLAESRRQQELVGECLHKFGQEPSTLKDLAMRAMGNVQSMMNAIAGTASGDEVLKHHFALYAFEHYEIAAYRSAIAMAEECDEIEIARICEGILAQEQAAAHKLGEMTELVTRTYVERAAADLATASR